jgi:beta-galactosidase
MKQRPFVWGTFVWAMFDFAVSTRHEGGVDGRNDKGLVTYDRQTRKDAFYFYKANWSAEPFVYITSRRFTERTNAVTNVKIYANTGPVELSLNGVSLGKVADGTNGIYLWNNVQLKLGENQVAVQAPHAGTNLVDQCVWTLKPAAQ